ncbi:sugar phosphate isomerase/epimerase family protein [Pseudolysinimonas sp.]|uniref:sugar phosphate isomerase/epimerase family protein n=1 Tax=Pseudolysinimonas sp. TaxID=2680009 RepID=UPI003F811AAB
MSGAEPAKGRIGVQAMMLAGEIAEHGVTATLGRVVDTGYRTAEISQVPMTRANVEAFAAARDGLGFSYAAISAALTSGGSNDGIDTAFDKIVDDARTLGVDLVRIGMLPPSGLRSLAAFEEVADRAEEAAHRFAEHGITLCYHNHHVEFIRAGAGTLLDVMVERAPSVGLELDAFWIARGGRDPERTITASAGRVRLVHLKDYRIAWPSAAALDAQEAGDAAAWSAELEGLVQFTEVGEGALDWRAIIAAADAAGVQHLLVEQDRLYGRDVWEALALSRRNLVDLGFGDRF